MSLKLIYFIPTRGVTSEENQIDELMVMRTEYEKYKDLWGLNIHYSHSAGATQNYSELGNLNYYIA